MLFKYKPNYFLATMNGGIEFNSKGEFKTSNDIEVQILEELGAVKVIAKKTTKK